MHKSPNTPAEFLDALPIPANAVDTALVSTGNNNATKLDEWVPADSVHAT